MKNFGQLKDEIRRVIWASGEFENLVDAHNDAFQEALAEIQKWVPGERDDNVNVVRFFKTRYNSGMTVLPAPKGIITRIYTVANENYSDPVFYRQVAWPEPEAWSRNLYLFPLPPLTALPRLARGMQFADPANDSLYGRARTGIWALHAGQIYIAPWIQSNEAVIVEWQGIKSAWDDLDIVRDDHMFKKAVKLYVQYAHERDYGDAERAMQFHNTASYRGHYDEALGDLIHEGELRTRVNRTLDGGHERNRLCAELADDAPPSTPDGIVIADLGNISLPGFDLDEVALLARSWNPDHVMATGMIAAGQQNYDLTAGSKFYDFITPYIGSQGIGGESNAFWAVPGQADWDKDGLASFKSFFPTLGNGRYYDVVLGDVHLFVLDSVASEPDGIDSGSAQGQWLQARLALSTSPWKVVKLEGCPYGSVTSNPTLQWPFRAWGAHMVISSQALDYERLSVSGLTVINNGLGGQTPIVLATGRTSNTLTLYAAGFGAGKLTANADNLQYEFFDVDGNLVDSVLIVKGAEVPVTPGEGQGVLVDPFGDIIGTPQGDIIGVP